MSFDLRPYQSSVVAEALAEMLGGGVPAVVVPTGGGKTVIMSEVARQALENGQRIVAVAHRGEIVDQIHRSMRKHLPFDTTIELVRAGGKTPLRSQVIIGMVPTLARRTDQLAHLKGCVLIQDECHHAGAKSWEAVTEATRPRYRMGFTATPIRPNGRGLGDEGGFTKLVLGPQPAELMEAGALCRYRMIAVPERMDSSRLRKKSTGDFSVEDMEREVQEINGNIVRDWRNFNPSAALTIFVGVSVDHAHAVAKMFNAEGIPAEAVDGKSPKAERAAIFDRFRSGRIRVLCACAVIDEGLDVPEATVLQVTRPTMSIRLWRQLVGRVLRPAPGKDVGIIIDHTDNWQRLAPPDAAIKWDLFQQKIEVEEPTTARRDEETGLVILEPVAGPGKEIMENGARMRDVTGQLLAKARPHMARKTINKEVMDAIDRARDARQLGGLKRLTEMASILENETLVALEAAAKMPTGWAAGQIMLNMVQTPKQLKAATERWQAEWGGISGD